MWSSDRRGTHLISLLLAVSACGRARFDLLGTSDDAPTTTERCQGTAVATGREHSCAIDPDGGVWCWGFNRWGQAAPGRNDLRVLDAHAIALPGRAVEIGAGRDITCARLDGGDVWCWGRNESGELGQGHTNPASSPVRVPLPEPVTLLAVGSATVCATRASDRSLLCWGENRADELGVPRTTPMSATPIALPNTAGAAHVAFGHRHACMLDDANGVRCWGRGSSGQLGDGTTASRPQVVELAGVTATAIAGGGRQSCLVDLAGFVRCFGRNSSGQLGTGNYTSHTSPGPSAIGGARSVAVGTVGSCAHLENGTIACWGAHDARGISQTPRPIELTGVTMLSHRFGHGCAIANGEVVCFGNNADGELGRGTRGLVDSPLDISVPGVVEIVSARTHGCARTANGLRCWGRPVLGDGTLSYGASPVPIDTGLATIEGVDVMEYRTCVWGGGTGRCWGDNQYGQVGTGAASPPRLPAPITVPVSGIVELVVGGFSTYALTATGVSAWGRGAAGQLGNGVFADSTAVVTVQDIGTPTKLVAGANHACAITAGQLRCWGNNGFGQVGDGTLANRAMPAVIGIPNLTDVTAGHSHTCALAQTTVYCWGRNRVGELGLGDRIERAVPTVVPLPPVVRVIARANNTCAVTASGEVYCWGRGDLGQLGPAFGDDVDVPVRIPVLDGSDEIVPGACLRRGGTAACWGIFELTANGDVSHAMPSPATAYCNRT